MFFQQVLNQNSSLDFLFELLPTLCLCFTGTVMINQEKEILNRIGKKPDVEYSGIEISSTQF